MLNEPSTITNKRRKSSLTRQHLIMPQPRSKTLPASSLPALTAKRHSDGLTTPELAIMKRVPLSDAKSAKSNGMSEKSATPTKHLSVTSSVPSTDIPSESAESSNKSRLNSEATVTPKSETASPQDNNTTGTLRKPKRPAPVKPAPKVPPTQKNSTEPTERSPHHDGPKRPAPTRAAPKHPNTAPGHRNLAPSHPDRATTNREPVNRNSTPTHQLDLPIAKENVDDDATKKKTPLEGVKSESSNKIKRGNFISFGMILC